MKQSIFTDPSNKDAIISEMNEHGIKFVSESVPTLKSKDFNCNAIKLTFSHTIDHMMKFKSIATKYKI